MFRSRSKAFERVLAAVNYQEQLSRNLESLRIAHRLDPLVDHGLACSDR